MVHFKKNTNIRIQLNIFVRLLIMLSALSFCILADYSVVHADNGETIVHVTRTGTCYHTADCYHLRSDKEITLYEAVVEYGYNPCSDCNPPIYDGPDEPHEPMEKPQGGGSNSNNESGNSTSSNSYNRESYDDDSKPSTLSIVIGIVIALFFPGCFVIGFIGEKIEAINGYAKNIKQRKENELKRKEEFEQSRQLYYSMYAGKTPISFVQVPSGAFIRDNLPCTTEKHNKPYGDYTVYVGKNAQVLHMNPNCGGANLNPVNYSLVCRLPHCKRCATGNITLPRLEWFLKYSEIENIKRKYNIP